MGNEPEVRKMRDFDVVVIGAGLGGLTSAAFLAKDGKKVLVADRHYVPGGFATSFLRGRFEFEVSLHELSGLGSENDPGPVRKLLDNLGVTRKVDFIQVPEFYRCVLPGVDIVLPTGRENFEETLCFYFPTDSEGIRKFISIMFDFASEALRANRVGMKKVIEKQEEFPTLLSYFGKTLKDVIDPLISNDAARAVLSVICGYYCNPPSRISFLTYALGTVSYLRFGPWHVKGKSQALSQALMDRIEEMGGEVWLRNGVERIIIQRGKVRGVMTRDGTEVASPIVVSNVNPYTTCLDLIGKEHVPEWYLKRLGAWSPGASTFNLYLGVDCHHERLGLKHHETFVSESTDLDGNWKKMRTGASMEPSDIAVTAYNTIDPEFSPPDTSSIVCTFIAYAEPWLRLRPEKYTETKNRIARKTLLIAEKVAEDLSKHIEVIDVATPLTNMHYTRNAGGSIIGFDETFTGTGITRMPASSPIEGLYFTGAWVNIGGGYEPSMYSGYLTSRQILKDLEGGVRGESIDKLRESLSKQVKGSEIIETPLILVDKAVSAFHPDRVNLRVHEIIRETASTKTIRFLPINGSLPQFRAGQYVNLFCQVDGTLTSRPYSISSPPGKEYWDLTVRRVENGFVSHFLTDRLKIGDELHSTSPAGSFYQEPLTDTNELVFLAGGSGITPFASIIRANAQSHTGYRIHLIYGSRHPDDVIFHDELRGIEKTNQWFKMDLVVSEPPEGYDGLTGFLDLEILQNLVGSFDGKTFYICGPKEMHHLCMEALLSHGVSRKRIKREAYGPPKNVTEESGWPGISPEAIFKITDRRTGKTFEARAGEPLMNSMERAGLVIEAVCRSGECSVCRTRLISGKVFIPEQVAKRKVDEIASFIHPCMSFPLSDLVLRT